MSTEQVLGLITGVLFGFLLQKGRVLRFDKQVGAMLLKDMTILKFMLAAILVGMIGILFLTQLGVLSASHKAMNLGGIMVGGALFGVGWALTGFCPGTSLGALAEGRWHALFAIAGMVAGAALYAEMYPFLTKSLLAWKDFGKISLASALGMSPWIVAVIFWLVSFSLFYWFEKKGV